jgi:enoyl-CoA hydratase/carnithine racemase
MAVTVDQRGDVAIIRFRHGKVFAFDIEICQDLIRALDQTERGVAATVLTASGSAA